MKTKEVKSIDIQAREHFDDKNGNSYFKATITINFGLDNETTLQIPLTYGYGNFYLQASKETLEDFGYIQETKRPLTYYCRENNIRLRHNIEELDSREKLEHWTIL